MSTQPSQPFNIDAADEEVAWAFANDIGVPPEKFRDAVAEVTRLRDEVAKWHDVNTALVARNLDLRAALQAVKAIPHRMGDEYARRVHTIIEEAAATVVEGDG